MKKFFAGILIYAISLFALGAVVLPTNSEASHKVWLYCHKADNWFNYPHLHKASGVHTKYKCYSVGYWVYVYAPWPH